MPWLADEQTGVEEALLHTKAYQVLDQESVAWVVYEQEVEVPLDTAVVFLQ